MMKSLLYEIRFTNPAFLGDAEQSGRWRTPPFKAQLRQWWRIAYAAAKNFNVNPEQMRREEGLLFGNAWLEGEFCKSEVRLRLSNWNRGSLNKTKWPADAGVIHPEVTSRDGKPVPVGSSLYLGYGPLTYDTKAHATGLKGNAAIQADEVAQLSVAFPAAPDDGPTSGNAARIERALWLMDRYGAMGGRSRNGWGSYSLRRADGGGEAADELPLRRWQDCLDRDWPHAIGRDERGPLIWQTPPFDDWQSMMKRLAEIKIGLRTQFSFAPGKDAPSPEPRHWLAYPVTHHSVRPWGNNARLPNTLRFKVRPTAGSKLVGVIFHVPCMAPAGFAPERAVIEDVWRRVNGYLDAPAAGLARVAS
jgi:CRISPR-associated protein Cmr1